eukprot:COSAG03_NODE_2757_length_2469_cov_206.190717_2_plen_165_part_00
MCIVPVSVSVCLCLSVSLCLCLSVSLCLCLCCTNVFSGAGMVRGRRGGVLCVSAQAKLRRGCVLICLCLFISLCLSLTLCGEQVLRLLGIRGFNLLAHGSLSLLSLLSLSPLSLSLCPPPPPHTHTHTHARTIPSHCLSFCPSLALCGRGQLQRRPAVLLDYGE